MKNIFNFQPFGDSLTGSSKLLDNAYIGMELDGERSQYHFNARSYDPKLSSFFAPDLLFDKFPNQSPYSYSNNNPVNFKDPSGMLTKNWMSLEEQQAKATEEFNARRNEPYSLWLDGRMGDVENGYNGIRWWWWLWWDKCLCSR